LRIEKGGVEKALPFFDRMLTIAIERPIAETRIPRTAMKVRANEHWPIA
jgi:hypothetical protein